MMVFMIGIRWQEKGALRFERFIAGAENLSHKRRVFEEFIAFLDIRTSEGFIDLARTAIYHRSSAGAWQTQHVTY